MVIQSTPNAGSRVTGAIQKAARATGTDFDYLLKTALRESNFDPNAKASTSSATGLFQFIEQTWLSTLRQAGASLGYGQYASAVVESPSGHLSVPDPSMRRAVMDLRLDPTANAAMAGALTRNNAVLVAAGIGRQPTDGELYIAHVLGASGAVKLISAAATTPQAQAATLFPSAARANHSIFFDGQGAPRTAAEVYAMLAAPPSAPVLASAETSAAPDTTVAPAPPVTQAAGAALAPPSRSAAIPARDMGSEPTAFAPVPAPRFRSLFQTDGRGPLSPVVSQLWGPGPEIPPVPDDPTTASPARNGATAHETSTSGRTAPLDLFQFLRPELGAAASDS